MAYGDGGLIQRNGTWYVRYFCNGQEFRKSTRTSDRTAAERARILLVREAKILNEQVRPLRYFELGRLTGEQIMALRRPLVYVWSRGDRVLYVGKSQAGLSRPLQAHHHRLRGLLPTDEIALKWCLTAADACDLENKLILKYRPKLNREWGVVATRRKTDLAQT